MTQPKVVRTTQELQATVAQWRRAGRKIGLVPTMGALHEGHLSLMREMARRADEVIVSVFVNPAQFAPHEDFDRYPRDLTNDLMKMAPVDRVDLVFAPAVSEIYPGGFATKIEVGGPALGLESDFRPHFFAGVATVVAKLLIAAMPDVAIFGEKDYQQLLVIRRLVADLGLAIEIPGGAIVREKDGLAMSSRNAYLDNEQRQIASGLNRVLNDVATKFRGGGAARAAEAAGTRALLEAGFGAVDYVALRHAETLAIVDKLSGPVRLLAAAKVGKTRLIDNISV